MMPNAQTLARGCPDATPVRAHQYKVYHLKGEPIQFPDEEVDVSRMPITSVDVDFSEVCNLACSYCFKGDLNNRRMSLDTAKQMVRFLVKASGNATGISVAVMGGEPMLSFDFLKQWLPYANNYARQRGKRLRVGITTNGTIFTQKHHDFFRFWHIGIHLSIDGLPEVQNQERVFKGTGKGSASKLEDNLPRILSAWPVVHARSTVVPETVHRLADSYQYFCDRGFQKVAFSLAACEQWNDRQSLDTLREQYDEVLTRHWQHMKKHGRYFVLTTLDEYVRNTARPDPAAGSTICGAGRGMLHVDVDGLLWPCHRFNSTIGPHRNLILGSVWGGFRNDLRECFCGIVPTRDMRARCQDCSARVLCHTPCIAANWQNTGDIFQPGPGYCEAFRVVVEALERHVARIKDADPGLWQRYSEWVENYRW